MRVLYYFLREKSSKSLIFNEKASGKEPFLKLACIEMKKTGKSNKVTLGIKNDSQIYIWLK